MGQSKAQNTIANLKQECTRLKGRIVQSPEKLKQVGAERLDLPVSFAHPLVELANHTLSQNPIKTIGNSRHESLRSVRKSASPRYGETNQGIGSQD